MDATADKRDQAAKLRERVKEGSRRSRPRPGAVPLVAVTGGKGGAGKTMVAVNLAAALREAGRRVLLVDLDPGLANADILLGVHPRVTLEECLQEGRPLTDSVMVGPAGIMLLPGASGEPRLTGEEAFARAGFWSALRALRPHVDLVLLDTGAGLSPAVMDPLGRADLALVVTNPEPAAVTDAYALLKVWHRRARTLSAGLVINRVRSREEAFLTATRLRRVARRFLGCRPELIGWLPDSPRVAESARSRRPFFLDLCRGEEREAMRTMAARLLRGLEGGVPADPPRGVDGGID